MLKVPLENEGHAQDEVPRDRTKGRPGERRKKKGAYNEAFAWMTSRVAARTPSYNCPRKLTNTVSRDVNEQRRNTTVDEACPRSWLCMRSVIPPLPPNDNLRGSLCGTRFRRRGNLSTAEEEYIASARSIDSWETSARKRRYRESALNPSIIQAPDKIKWIRGR